MERIVHLIIAITVIFQLYKNIRFNLRNEEFKEIVIFKIITYFSLLIGLTITKKAIFISILSIVITIMIPRFKGKYQ